MDAALVVAGVIEELALLLGHKDFEGAEELLTSAFPRFPDHEPFLHLQLAKVYRQWNKLSSAVNHLNRAAELGGRDPYMRLQIAEELLSTRQLQAHQRP